ncbi:40S ribosomal S15-like [Olea europaea subsp. europaea]|uniref:40S ribosomal S15-like n=1 Tax=Olea europaea subsp. europaea TaxID=158383 RepID=A0A8S0PNW4_OLEEU|nr:40S ribosomal S15-like [Olea europaea subsp. europaea]
MVGQGASGGENVNPCAPLPWVDEGRWNLGISNPIDRISRLAEILELIQFVEMLLMKREAPPGEKPEVDKTHLRNMIIVPEMIGGVIGVYNGKTFNTVEIKPEMISHYLVEFSISYKPVKHGRPSIGVTHTSSFISLKIYSQFRNIREILFTRTTMLCFSLLTRA